MKKNKYQHYLDEVEKKLLTLKPPVKKDSYFDLQKYVGTSFAITGLSMKELRRIFKAGFSFSDLQPDEQYPIWKYIWYHAHLHDAMSMSIFFCDGYLKIADKKEFCLRLHFE